MADQLQIGGGNAVERRFAPRRSGEQREDHQPEAAGPATGSPSCATIARALDREIPVLDITPDEFRAEAAQFIPEPVMKMLLDYWSDTLTTPDRPRPVTPVTGRPGRTLAQWAADHRADFGG